MKKILFLFLIMLLFIIGCGKEETKDLELITAEVYDIDEPEITEVVEEEKDDIKTVKLCHDTDNGMVKWAGGTVFGYYDNTERFEFNDYCFDNNIMIEYYCEDENPKNMTFICKSGCEDNHCI